MSTPMDPSLALNPDDQDIWSLPPLTPSAFPADSFSLPFDLIDPCVVNDNHDETFPEQNQSISKRRRGKAYTGCLTCRERKIKCDEARPVCNNCERSRHYTCRGWVDSTGTVAYDCSNGQVSKRQRLIPRSQLVSSRGLESSREYHLETTHTALPETFRLSSDELPNTPALSESHSINRTPGEFGDLITHYRDVIGHVMMPIVDDARNPWLQLYLPLALKEQPTKTQLALRYALLSVSAHHRARVSDKAKPGDSSKARELREMAEKTIEEAVHHISEHSPTSEKCSLLAAAMSMITIDVFSGNGNSCSANIELSKSIFHTTGGDSFWKSNLQASILYQLLRCYGLIANSAQAPLEDTRPGIEYRRQHMPSAAVQETHSFAHQHYFLGMTFGIGLKTITLLDEVLHAASLLSSKNDQTTRSPELVETIQSLEERLHMTQEEAHDDSTSNLPIITLAELGFKNSRFQPSALLPPIITEELMTNHQQAFHKAVILFFYRVLYQSSLSQNTQYFSTRKHRKNCQEYVDQIFESLENIDCLTRGAEIRPASALWPAFIAGCEAIDTSLRHRVLVYFTKSAKRGFGNVERAKKLIMEVWRRTDRCFVDDVSMPSFGLGLVDWRVVMKESGVFIMLC